jgi:hypothetical protein
MNVSMTFAIIYGMAGFASAAYAIRTGAKHVPVISLGICALFTLGTYGFVYGFLTVLEFAIGFGLAHAFIKSDAKKKSEE